MPPNESNPLNSGDGDPDNNSNQNPTPPPLPPSQPDTQSYGVPHVINGQAVTPPTQPGGSNIVSSSPGGQVDNAPLPMNPYNPSNYTDPVAFSSVKKKRNMKPFIIGGGAAAFVLLLGAGFVLGYYLPNKPENVWKTGLSRSGKALDKLVTNATEKETVDSFKKSEFSLTAEATWKDGSFNGTASVKYDESKLNGSVDFTSKTEGEADQKYSAKLLSELPKDESYPTTFFQLSGIKTLGLESMLPGINEYDGKWIVVDKEYVRSLSDSYGAMFGSMLPMPDSGGDAEVTAEASKEEPQLTHADVTEVVRAMSAVNNEYLFNPDPKKSVLENRQSLGREKVDDISAFHYRVGVNKDNYAAYCKALEDRFFATNAFKKFNEGKDISDADEKAAHEGCDSSSEGIKASDEFDLWVDSKYKLIYKIRFTDKEDQASYLDVGQKYKGGDNVSFFVAWNGGKEKFEGKFTLDTNLKTSETSGAIDFSGGEADDKFNAKATFEAKPLQGEVVIDKPKDAIKIEDIFKKYGVDPAEYLAPPDDSSGLSSNPEDKERQIDVTRIASELEMHYATNGSYPTLAEINSPTWRKKNMPRFDDETLKDPKGTSMTLASLAKAGQYGYAPTPAGCGTDACQDYKLEAILSTGKPYTERSMMSNE